MVFHLFRAPPKFFLPIVVIQFIRGDVTVGSEEWQREKWCGGFRCEGGTIVPRSKKGDSSENSSIFELFEHEKMLELQKK